MAIRPNLMKAQMQSGKTVAALNISRWRGVDAAEIARTAGYEWLFIDLEHSVINEELAAQIALTAMAVGVTPIARVGTDQLYQAARLLDAGLQGIVFPHVDDAQQARRIARATKYPPLGARSLAGPLPQAEFKPAADPASMAALNKETLTIVMIETQTALDNIDAIVAVEGVDGVLIGTNDLAADLGIAGQLGDARIAAAYARVGAAARNAGKFFGMGGVYSKELIARYLKSGVQFLLGGADIGFLIEGARARREMIAGAM